MTTNHPLPAEIKEKLRDYVFKKISEKNIEGAWREYEVLILDDVCELFQQALSAQKKEYEEKIKELETKLALSGEAVDEPVTGTSSGLATGEGMRKGRKLSKRLKYSDYKPGNKTPKENDSQMEWSEAGKEDKTLYGKMPQGYLAKSKEADRRMAAGIKQKRCEHGYFLFPGEECSSHGKEDNWNTIQPEEEPAPDDNLIRIAVSLAISCEGVSRSQRVKIIQEALADQKKELVEEVVALSDKIEMGKDETSMDEWRAFKRFRNTLRDKYIL